VTPARYYALQARAALLAADASAASAEAALLDPHSDEDTRRARSASWRENERCHRDTAAYWAARATRAREAGAEAEDARRLTGTP
jgi:hypothetical protein